MSGPQHKNLQHNSGRCRPGIRPLLCSGFLSRLLNTHPQAIPNAGTGRTRRSTGVPLRFVAVLFAELTGRNGAVLPAQLTVPGSFSRTGPSSGEIESVVQYQSCRVGGIAGGLFQPQPIADRAARAPLRLLFQPFTAVYKTPAGRRTAPPRVVIPGLLDKSVPARPRGGGIPPAGRCWDCSKQWSGQSARTDAPVLCSARRTAACSSSFKWCRPACVTFSISS